jgi:hypothetical protein
MRKLMAAVLVLAAACGSGGGNGNQQQATASPVFAPAGGTYNTTQSVAITCATAGATIRYTIDGSTPTAASPAYAAPIAVTTTTTIKAFATSSGRTDSAVVSATYTLQSGAPVFAPTPGTYATAQSVTITSATPSAVVHYTTDGSTPTSASTAYTVPISLPVGATAETTTIKAIAIAAGFADSAVVTAVYVIDPGATQAATPTFSPAGGTYTSAQSVTISCATSGVSIYYTTDGSDPTTASNLYTAAIPVSVTTTIKAIAAGGGHTQSAIASATYIINLPQAAAPGFSPPGGTYSSAQSVTISSATPGAVIHYTSDGSTPTTGSPTYSAPIAVSTTTTLKAIATATGYTQSAVSTATYTISTGTDFLTLCNGVQTAMRSLQATCLHANPAYLAAVGTGGGIPCDELNRESPSLMTFDQGQGTACLAAAQALTCADMFGQGEVALPASCDAALVGLVATNGTCYDSENCTSGFCTSDFTLTCPGTCQPFAQLSESCSSAECASGLTCDNNVCKTASGVNGACPCQDGLWCDGSGGAPGVCKAPQTSGACSATSFGQCAAGYACVGITSTCQPMVGLGGDCTAGSELCGPGYTCASGSCVSFPQVGDACSPGTTPICIGGYCATSTCVAFKGLGASCTFDFECASFNCNAVTNVCTLGYCVMP